MFLMLLKGCRQSKTTNKQRQLRDTSLRGQAVCEVSTMILNLILYVKLMGGAWGEGA